MASLDCPYCGARPELVTGSTIYPHRPDLTAKQFWRCPGACGAWVGCHPGTTAPLGRLANAELRAAKRAAHDAFDPLWQPSGRSGSKNKRKNARGAAYAALGEALGIPAAEVHIGMMSVEQCRRVVEVCKTLRLPS